MVVVTDYFGYLSSLFSIWFYFSFAIYLSIYTCIKVDCVVLVWIFVISWLKAFTNCREFGKKSRVSLKFCVPLDCLPFLEFDACYFFLWRYLSLLMKPIIYRCQVFCMNVNLWLFFHWKKKLYILYVAHLIDLKKCSMCLIHFAFIIKSL